MYLQAVLLNRLLSILSFGVFCCIIIQTVAYNPEKITYFAETDSRNKHVSFGIKAKDRTRHVYCIGKTGMGKSTLLENMAIQDIQSGEGMAFVDPHGKTADLLLEYVPQERIKDVIYFAPFDTEYPISFNVMEDVGADRRHLVANGLMSAFKKIWVDAWSARMEYILNNILLALLEYPDSTLVGVNRMLSDKAYRKKVVANISDPSVKSFWVDEFEKYGERYMQEAGAAIQNKVGQFVSNPLVRNIIGQPKSTFDLRKVMDEQKIVIVNLSKGRVGEQNANLLGSMLITKIYLSAMSRADVNDRTLQSLPNFYLYVDEFQSFANESFADILSEARKYKLNLTIAHQYIEQMSEEVRAAVFGNVGTMITFRVGAYDAEVLEKEFFPTFTAEDLVNLGSFQVYLKLMIDGVSSAAFSAVTSPPIPKPEISFRQDIIENSRATFARPRGAVEEDIKKWHEDGAKPAEAPASFKPQAQKSFPPKDTFQKPIKSEERKEKAVIFETVMRDNKHSGGVVKPEPQAPRVQPVQEKLATPQVGKPISLDALKPPKNRDDKKPTPEHVNQLREALAQLTKKSIPITDKQSPVAAHKVQNTNKVAVKIDDKKENEKQTKSPAAEGSLPTSTASRTRPNEIPEDELRRMLSVDAE